MIAILHTTRCAALAVAALVLFPAVICAEETGLLLEHTKMKLLLPEGVKHEDQNMDRFSSAERKWMSDDQLFVLETKEFDKVTVAFDTKEPISTTAVLRLTRAPDYGMVRVELDSKVIAHCVNCFGLQVEPFAVTSSGPVQLAPGSHRLTFVVLGKDDRSGNSLFGFDYIRFGGAAPVPEVESPAATHSGGVDAGLFEFMPKHAMEKPKTARLAYQGMVHFARGPATWHNDDQLWVRDMQRNDKVVLAFDLEKAVEGRVVLQLTKAPDYATLHVTLDDKPLVDFDGYDESVVPAVVKPDKPVKLAPGQHRLGLKVTGKNRKSDGMAFGIDYLKLPVGAQKNRD